MANVNDSIVDMYEDFLFSDKEMEELDLYKHIEGVKNSKYLDVFNTLIENLETRRKRNFYLKKSLLLLFGKYFLMLEEKY